MSVIQFAKKGNDHLIHNFSDSNQLPTFAFKPETGMQFSSGAPHSYSKVSQYGSYIKGVERRDEDMKFKRQVLFDTNQQVLRKRDDNEFNEGKGLSARPIRGNRNLYTH
jgi:hypothetical protein